MRPTRLNPASLALAIALASSGTLALLPLHAAQAAEARLGFSIASGPLEQTLRQIARQSGRTLVADPALLQGKQAAAVQGDLSAEEAVRQALSGTNLQLLVTGNGALTVQEVETGSALQLGATSISTSRLGATTEGTGSYTTGTASMLKGNTRFKDIPQSVSVITRQQMQDQNIQTVDEAMMETPGISKSVTNAGNHVFLSRGFEIRNYQFDGTPMGYWAKGGYGQQADMAMYDHVEVLRGAAGMLIGAGDPSGTVNLVRKRPTDEFQLNVAAQAGSWSDYRTELDISAPLTEDKRLRGRAVLSYESKDFFYDGAHAEMPFFYGVMDYALTDDTTVALGMRYQKAWQPRVWAGNLPGSSDGTDLRLSRSTGLAPDWTRQLDETYEVFADINHDFNENWHGKIAITHLQNKDDAKYVWTQGRVNPATLTGASLIPYYSWDNARETALDANITGAFDAFGYKHRVTFGANYMKETENSAQGFGWSTPYPLDFSNLNVADMPKPTSLTMTPDNIETINRGVYGNVNLQLAEPLHLILGGRVSKFDYRDVYDGTASTAQENGQVTPYAALLLDITPEWTVYTSYTDIFNPQYNYKSATGTALKPTTGYNYEVGIKGELLDGRLNTSLAAFYIRQKDRGQQLDSSECQGNRTVCYTTGGEVESKGIEMQVSGEIVDRWQASVGYTYNRQVYLKDLDSSGQNFSDSTPKHLFRAYTSYQLAGPLQRLTVGGGMTAQSDTHYLSRGYTYAQNGYSVWNTFARYQLDDHWNVQLNANNIFDRYYYEDQGGRLYGTPRNYTVTLSGSF